MNQSVLLGLGHHMLPIPRMVWQDQVGRGARHGRASLGFMTEDHHRVRDLVVRELPRIAAPLSPELIAGMLSLPMDRLQVILDELERHMTFLFRNREGAVAWAYPVTADPTPHRVTFSTGERIYAAWGVDAIATPFVQGQLRQEQLTFSIETSCAHCGYPIHIEMDSNLNYSLREADAAPLVFAPQVDFGQLKDPSIIDAFWRKSVFFWSEEHAREYRRQAGGVSGTYMTISQSAYVTRRMQSALFAFPRPIGAQ